TDRLLTAKTKQEIEPKGEFTGERPVFMPPVDIYEEKENLVLVADMPGVREEDVDIHLEDNVLTLKAKVEDVLKGVEPIVQEYRVGDYYRRFTISSLVDPEKISAHMKDGILKIILPKAEAKKPRKIQVTKE
ncbi:MAG: Hsp20/alpha crystallin family protein, partial [Desulfatiglandales bacterium]